MSDENQEIESSEDLFDAWLEACDDYEFGEIVMTAIELIVSVAKSSEDDAFARSIVPLLISAAHYLEKTGANDEPVEESRIIRLN